jgi:hypothetical protein
MEIDFDSVCFQFETCLKFVREQNAVLADTNGPVKLLARSWHRVPIGVTILRMGISPSKRPETCFLLQSDIELTVIWSYNSPWMQ